MAHHSHELGGGGLLLLSSQRQLLCLELLVRLLLLSSRCRWLRLKLLVCLLLLSSRCWRLRLKLLIRLLLLLQSSQRQRLCRGVLQCGRGHQHHHQRRHGCGARDNNLEVVRGAGCRVRECGGGLREVEHRRPALRDP
jgi:hypothetical protein